MPKSYGVKDKDRVIAYIMDRLLAGELRGGDRLDRSEIAATLGVSRVPVQEALVQLENDGVISTEYYRGAFVEQFDASVVDESHRIYGLLSGIASAEAARNPTPRVLRELGSLLARMRDEPDSAEFEDRVWEFRRTVNHDYAGARLRAALSSFQSFMPKAFWVSYVDNQARMLPFYEDEYAAIRRGDPEAAAGACAGRSAAMAEIVTRELVRRGVFDPDATADIDAELTPVRRRTPR